MEQKNSMSVEPVAHAPLPDLPTVERGYREVNDVSLHVVAAGDPNDPLVVFLHGFPEFWYQWHDYIEPFVEAGYRVVVPDQRGYNRSERPAGVRPYRLTELSGDIVDLIATEDRETAHVVGHDWGAFVGWDLALRHPEMVDRLGIINVPHPEVLQQVIRSNLTQFRKSWYVFFFQVPGLPQWVLRRDDYEFLAAAMRDGSRPSTFSESELDRYRQAWAGEGTVTAMINWYRAIVRHSESPPRKRVQASTQIIWGENDRALVPELAPKSLSYCDDGDLKQFSDATHWIPHEHPQRVFDLLLDHLGS
jgi:pimeloyl-ACP methyl ester carboxylesterase